jgi:hypothetical protein
MKSIFLFETIQSIHTSFFSNNFMFSGLLDVDFYHTPQCDIVLM